MNNIKIVLKACLAFAFAFFMPHVSCSNIEVDSHAQKQEAEIAKRQLYSLTMKLHVPRIYNNMESLGWRKYQRQTIKGTVSLDFDSDGNIIGASFANLRNITHVLSNGKNVTYTGNLDTSKSFIVVAIGNNKTSKFNTSSICFSLMAEPSYNIGEFDEDTSLFVTLAGHGSMKNGKIKTASGNVAGTLGCGCYAYGHVSPTRVIRWEGTSNVVTDIAAVHGTWKMTAIK